MASFVYNEAKYQLMVAGLQLATADLRISLHMTNTTLDTENDGIATNTDFTTPDEFDGANYASPGQALGSLAVTKEDGSDLGKFDAADEVFTALGVGTRNIAGALLYKFITNWAASVPIAWFEFTATPDSSDFTVQWNASGLLTLT